MKFFPLCSLASLALLSATPSLAAQQSQPPMDQFNNAFYNCDNGAAFLISYDSARPKTAAMTTSNNSKRYDLKRAAVASGAKFEGGGATFWTDGETVTVEGTEIPLLNCKKKPN